jgi:putative copper export protein
VEVFKILNFWIHLISAIFWIGGMLFFSIVLLPSIQKRFPPETGGALLRDIYLRFQSIAVFFVPLLLITGGINIHFSHLARGVFTGQYTRILITKILFFTVLVTLYVLNMKNLSETRKKPTLQRLPFQDTSVVLGVLIVLMAAFLKHTP